MTALQLAGFVVQLVAWAGELGVELLKGTLPPTPEDLVRTIETALRHRTDDWIAQTKKDADVVFDATVQG